MFGNNNLISIFGHVARAEQNILAYFCEIYGFNRSHGYNVCSKFGISIFARVSTVSYAKLLQIKQFIEKNYVVEKSLKKLVSKRIIINLKKNTFKAKRFLLGLPVRGQSGRTNGKTAKRLLKIITPKGFSLPFNPPPRLINKTNKVKRK
jgi:small subunit ribosomal protein S13